MINMSKGKMERTEQTMKTVRIIADDKLFPADSARNLLLAEIALSLSVIADIMLITSENTKEPV